MYVSVPHPFSLETAPDASYERQNTPFLSCIHIKDNAALHTHPLDHLHTDPARESAGSYLIRVSTTAVKPVWVPYPDGCETDCRLHQLSRMSPTILVHRKQTACNMHTSTKRVQNRSGCSTSEH